MKRLLTWGVILAAIFTLTNCTEEIPDSTEAGDISYSLIAKIADTGTASSESGTSWAENDSLSVFHAPAGSDEYSGNSRFDLADAASCLFKASFINGAPAPSNDWYVLYPYNKYLSSPAGTTKGYHTIGSKSNAAQTQTGNDSMEHLAGENYPMWGVQKNVSENDEPSLTMEHISAFVEVVVTNSTESELTVSTITMTGTEPIVGTYSLDITGESPVITTSDDKYVSNVARLKVIDGEAIPAQGTASFHFAVKPFTAAAGKTLTISVNGKKKNISLEEDAVFTSGKVKTLDYVYDAAEDDDNNGGNEDNPEEVVFQLNPNAVSLSADGGEFDITIKSTIGYYISEMPEWIHEVSMKKDENNNTTVHTFQADANPDPDPRKGTIVFCGDNYACVPVSVTQEGGTTEAEWAGKDFLHRSVAFRFTADWCGYCPMMATALYYAQSEMPGKIEAISMHGSGGLVFSAVGALQGQFGVNAYPTGIVDGRVRINNSAIETTATAFVNAVRETEEHYPAQTGISFESSLDGRKLTLKSTVYMKKAGTYKITVLLVEDNIVGYQSGESNNYVHNGVGRIALSDILGDEISTQYDNRTHTQEYSCNIPSEYNLDNIRIVVYTHTQFGSQEIIRTEDYGAYYIDNCVTGKAGENVGLKFADEYTAPDRDERFDPDFLSYLLEAQNYAYNETPSGRIDSDGDGKLSFSEIAAITGLNMTGSGVGSLKGIELMSNLQYFEYNDGNLPSLDLSKCSSLSKIHIRNNSLSDIALPPSSPSLTIIHLEGNNLTSLDLAGNAHIVQLYCQGNRLTELDLSTNSGVRILDCSDNMITSLDISNLGCFYTEEGILHVGNQKNGINLTLSIAKQQESIWNKLWSAKTENSNVTLSVQGESSVEKPTAVIFSQEESVYCDGESSGKKFSCDLSNKIDRSFFSISFDYLIESGTDTKDMPFLVLSGGYRTFGINTSNDVLSVTINNQSGAYVTPVKIKFDEWQHVEVVHNNGHVLVNGEYIKIGDLNPGGDNQLASVNYSNGKAFKGTLKNIVVKSGK